MAQLDICEVCGKKTKFMFICPHCKKSLCMKHRRRGEHNCEDLVEEPLTTPVEEIVEPLKGSLGPSEEEIEPPVEEIVEPEEELVEQDEDLKIIMEDVIPPSSEQVSDLSVSPDRALAEILETDPADIVETVEEFSEEPEEDLIESKEESIIETDQEITENREKTFRIVKILTFSSIILLTIVSISLNGYLYFKVDADKNILLEEYNMLAEKNALIEHQYNELYSEYEYLEEQYELAKESNSDLEEQLNQTQDYENHIQLEEMKQITIPPNSNAVFFYEIPAPGYITVEYYSDVEVYAMVGSTLLDDVYYSRNPLGLQKSSELTFSVPVTPNLNILFENTDRDNSATVFFGINYYSQ